MSRRRISDSESLPVLTASEIGAYTFCGEAWYLRRRQVPRADFGDRRLQQGTAAHRQIGKRTERLRGIERLRVVLLAATIILLAVIAMEFGARLP
jgi:hypothetical protein